eukprot:6174898-Pleurochrysis_carterae.AAC.4
MYGKQQLEPTTSLSCEGSTAQRTIQRGRRTVISANVESRFQLDVSHELIIVGRALCRLGVPAHVALKKAPLSGLFPKPGGELSSHMIDELGFVTDEITDEAHRREVVARRRIRGADHRRKAHVVDGASINQCLTIQDEQWLRNRRGPLEAKVHAYAAPSWRDIDVQETARFRSVCRNHHVVARDRFALCEQHFPSRRRGSLLKLHDARAEEERRGWD